MMKSVHGIDREESSIFSLVSETKIDIIYIYFRKLERARPCKRERLPKTTPETETLSKRIEQSEDTCLLPSKEAKVKDTIPTIERIF